MAETGEMLRSTLGKSGYAVLTTVMRQGDPASGRAIAAELGVSPTTASTRLAQLEVAGLVRSSRAGRAKLWRLNTDSDVIRAWLREQRGFVVEFGSNPVSTGAGGVTLERKIAADYLGRLLLGHTATGLGDSRRVVSVAFQQAPRFTADDMVIEAAEEDEAESSLVLAVGARRTPDLVQSDEKSRALFRAFVQQLLIVPPGGPELRLGLAVAATQKQVGQLQELARLAGGQSGASGFFELIRTPRKFDREVQDRLRQVEGLVRLALVDLGVPDPSPAIVELRVWELLSRLVVLQPRMEVPDDSDWAALANALIPVARGTDIHGAIQLRDRLLTLADDWAPTAAVVKLPMLRRAAHDVLDLRVRRHRAGWQALELLNEQAHAAISDQIASADGSRQIRLDRTRVTKELTTALGSAAAVVLHGESGVGKSAVVLGLDKTIRPEYAMASSASAELADAGDTQVVCLNLRHLPPTAVEFEAALGARLQDLLSELSAPRRVLVVDGADAVAEGARDLLTYVVGAAVAADVRVVAATVGEVRQLVVDTVVARTGGGTTEVVVPPLTDAQIALVVGEFGELEAMAGNPRSRELLRRPVLIDLLVRGGLQGAPVSDIDAMQQIWEGLVRRKGSSERGTPDARDIVMLQVARQALQAGGDQLDAAATLDPVTVEGLRSDGLLRRSQNPFRPAPEFAHDEVRRYALARLMVADGDPTQVLRGAGVPRWALGAARLACQALFTVPGSGADAIAGRFGRWQAKFDKLVEDGHGARWGDVPGEALLTLGDPRPVLRDAWEQLQQHDRAGVQQLVRLTDQRLRGQDGLVRISAVEPLVEVVLESEVPWRSSESERTLLLEWLRSLAYSDVPTGYALRERLRIRLLAFCAAADNRLREEEEARAAARAAITDEQRAAQKARLKGVPMFGPIGYPRVRPRKSRPAISREIADKTIVELLALLGPDLGMDGEEVLRRVADADPSSLAPAVEGALCGRALAGYQRGFLADMVLAYYLDEEDDGSRGTGTDDGVRDHQWIGIGVPLSAWYRGPFMALFQSDFRNGIAVLNRILNHAAAVRSRILAGIGRFDGSPSDADAEQHRVELRVSGERHVYVGDSGVWNWYRGTGVGPFPCMSALQALERVCDNYIALEMPLELMTPILLDGCDNLAMIAFIVGLLVRHLDKASTLLDPFLSEPDVWHFEFARVAVEFGGLRGSSEGVTGGDRRGWSMREAAASLALAADPERADALRIVGHELVENTRRRLEALGEMAPAEVADMELSSVRAWASGLDRSTYTLHRTEQGYLVQSNPPADAAAILSDGMSGVLRSQEAMRLSVRYGVQHEGGATKPISIEELISDLDSAAALIDRREDPDMMGWDGPAAVAACALDQHLAQGHALPDDSIKFAASVVLRIGEGAALQRDRAIEESYFSQGADRSAARALPLLLTPAAEHVRHLLASTDETAADARLEAAATALAQSNVLQTRLFLARGLDHLWTSPCNNDTTCPHHSAFRITTEMMRDSVRGPWDMGLQQRPVELLDDPMVDTLPVVPPDSVYVSKLDAAIRALAPAVAAGVCVSEMARALLEAVLDAQRRALLADEYDTDERGSHALAAARALLTTNDDAWILNHVAAYVDNSTVLGHALGALGTAAQEDAQRASTALRVWPDIVETVISAHHSGHDPFDNESAVRDYTLAALLPTLAGEFDYLHAEFDAAPIAWWDPVDWQATIERWLDVAGGKPRCVDNLVRFLAASLPQHEQARLGIPWVTQAVLADPGAIAERCYSLTDWLIEIRATAEDTGLSSDWQRAVDALVVAGEIRLATYSE